MNSGRTRHLKGDRSTEKFADSESNFEHGGAWAMEQSDFRDVSSNRMSRKSIKTPSFEAGKNKSYVRYVEFEGSRIVRVLFRKKRARGGHGFDISRK